MTAAETIELQYRGFLQTPAIGPIAQIPGITLWPTDLDTQRDLSIPPPEWFGTDSNILGKRMERMLHWQLLQSNRFEVLCDSVQIKEQKVTIGELDFLLRDHKANQQIHLEFAYKLYLYNPEASHPDEIWVGPNRRDTLHRKLKKLRDQQFSLLHHPATKEFLTVNNWGTDNFNQWLCLKAQLYLPKDYFEKAPEDINPLAVAGIWIRGNQLNDHHNHSFFLPNKIDWSMRPHHKVQWMNFDHTQKEIKGILAQKRSPMCWAKAPTGELERMFVVWW